MALPKLEGRITLTTSHAFTLTDDDHPAGSVRTIPAGEYYLTSSGAQGTLLGALGFHLNDAASGGTVTYTVALDDDSDTSTGKLTITPSSGTVAITWTSTTLRDLLGFATDVTATSSAVGTKQCKYLWLPNTGRSGVLAPEPSSASSEMGARKTDYSFAQAPGGQSVRLVYSTRYFDTLQFDALKGSKTWKTLETTSNESLEQFYDDVIGLGTPLRYHSSRDSNVRYWTMVVADAGEFRPAPAIDGWVGANSLWRVSYEMWKFV